MATYPFLSDEWIAEARRIREEFDGDSSVPHVMKMNLNITEVPAEVGQDDPVAAHMDTTSGELELDTGHLEGPDLTVTVDYATAKAIFVEGNPQAGMQAFMAGKIKVEGDMTKMMAMQTATPDAGAAELAKKIADITA